MEIKSLLQIGVGKTGNVLLDGMMSLDNRYVGLFINSAKKDMEFLENYTEENSFAIPQADGSGKNRAKAMQYVLKWKDSFRELLSQYRGYNTIVFYFSTDGGTGSGCVPGLAKFTKNLFKQEYEKDVDIIMVAALPKTNVSINGLKNSMECWNDIMKLKTDHLDEQGNVMTDEYGQPKKPTVSTVYFIDNNKRETLEEINEEATAALNMAFNFNTFDINGDIDTNDSKNINVEDGYNLILPLPAGCKTEEEAIIQAKEDSVFVLPDREYFNPKSLGVILKEDTLSEHNIETIVGRGINDTYPGVMDSEEEYDEEDREYADIDGILFFGGLSIPTGAINVINNIVEEKESELKRSSSTDKNSLFVTVSRGDKNKKSTSTSVKPKSPVKKKAGKRVKKVIDDSMFDF